MIYLDTNILIYATLSNVDTQSQQDKAIEILRSTMKDKTLLLSNLNILEYTFVMKKAKEDNDKIKSALELFQAFVKDEKNDFSTLLVSILNENNSFKNSFDAYHVAFANAYNCSQLTTFDKGFKKFITNSNISIEIL